MSEASTIREETLPLTVNSLAEQFAACGLSAGQTVLVHSSMSKIGWIAGGAEAVIRALLQVVTSEGTIMMPSHTTNNTDPAEWQHPPVPAHWVQIIRDNMPAFDPATTPGREMGAIGELFRTWPGAKRSNHPVGSFAALGPNANFLLDSQQLEDELGETSPLGKLYELDGYVMLIGVNHFNNTSLHLAENRANYPGKKWHQSGAAIYVNGQRQWVYYRGLQTYGDDFGAMGDAYDAAYNLTLHKVGTADVRFMPQRTVVDFAAEWIEKNRDLTQETV